MVIRNKVFQWRITFNLDLTKQVQKVIVCRKTKKLLHSSISFNNIPLKNSMSQKHLRLTLDVKLNFVEHKKKITQKISKNMGLLRRFRSTVSISLLLIIYKLPSRGLFRKRCSENMQQIYRRTPMPKCDLK